LFEEQNHSKFYLLSIYRAVQNTIAHTDIPAEQLMISS